MKRATTIIIAAFLITLEASAQTSKTSARMHKSVGEDLAPTGIAERAFLSVVLLMMSDANGEPLSLGSGFFVLPNVVATNVHVVSGASSGYARLVGRDTKLTIKGIVGVDPDRDLVLLAISDANAPPLALGNSELLAVGDSVFSVGNPRGLEGTFSQGIVSGIRKLGSDTLLQITAPISPGSSGGPVMDTKGAVVGVAVATVKGGQNLNFAIPTSYLKPLLARVGSPEPLSHTAASASSSSITSTFDSRPTEALEATNFLWDTDAFYIRGFSFSLKNRLQSSVRDVYLIVIFYDNQGAPIDVTDLHVEAEIPASLARRIRGTEGEGVKRLTTQPRNSILTDYGQLSPYTKVEFRMLDFTVAEQ